jgi:pantoate--beta-alanine ligase
LDHYYKNKLKTVFNNEDIRHLITGSRTAGKSIGLVPTMGALHFGHLSIVDCCSRVNDVTVVTIFVNPSQFNDPKDLENYPRDLARDLRMLEQTGCDIVFVPTVQGVYPKPDLRIFDFGPLDKIMEGQYRPGHFNGVAQVVSRLFEIIKPDRAYFGEKDIQQLAVIRRLTEMLKIPVEVKACPTVRESDGLAMSSRNVLLNGEQRKSAVLISQTLRKAAQKRELKAGEIKKWVTDTINSDPFLDIEYFEIVDNKELQPVGDLDMIRDDLIGCIAVRAGKVRLIDNIFFCNFAVL